MSLTIDRVAAPDVRRHRTPLYVAACACVIVAAASLLVPSTLTYDAWAWLVWGREVRTLALDTTGGPTWKPLPVFVTTPLSALPAWSAPLWMLVARAAGLFALVAIYRLGHRLGGVIAGVVAAATLVVTPDAESRFVRLLLEGHTAPLEAALALWTIERHFADRPRTAFLIGGALGLLRPEVWPILVVYGAWLGWRSPRDRVLVGATAAVVTVAWIGGDLWGSGTPFHGAEVAQVATGDALDRLGRAINRTWDLVPLPAWIAAGVALVDAWRRRRDDVLAVAAMSATWIAIVVSMSVVLGYAALSRFLLPAAAGLCALAGVGVAVLVGVARRGSAAVRIALATACTIALVAFVPRVASVVDAFDEARERTAFADSLDAAIARAGGPDVVGSCGPVGIEHFARANPMLPAAAWKLDLPLAAVVALPAGQSTGTAIAQRGSPEDGRLAQSEATKLAETSLWRIYRLPGACDRGV